MSHHHHRILLVTYPAQGHINPALQFAKRLISMGAHVTLPITLHLYRRLILLNPSITTISNLSITPFSDGYNDGFIAITNTDADFHQYTSQFNTRGSDFITNLILSAKQESKPFTCLLYTIIIPWAPRVARGFNLRSAKLWIEPATVFDILYYYFHGYSNHINNQNQNQNQTTIELPGLPFTLSPRDIPSFLFTSNPSVLSFVFPYFQQDFHELDVETNPIILVNTFEALEPEALRAVDTHHNLKMIPIGPLIPSDTSFSGDLLQPSNDYIEWLNSKSKSSVVYVSFGSYFVLSERQTEEIASALLNCGFSFLWVMREKEEELKFKDELEKKGKIVKWCSQVEVLSHSSLGCFLTHCGWNSTLESLVSGVPLVAFPQWTDQKTNAKLIEDVWKIGVRVDDKVDEDGIVGGNEIKKCLEEVMGRGEKGEELRKNAMKWKGLAREAGKEGGPAEKNLRKFLDDILENACMDAAKN
ncbi:putative crocetin glucosyltransferase [Medicago truncatula]|uniref:Glycosyltransferase n=1 Tax=Medicago truncatula TaxID=3880 RepID=G7LH44_MEDTR|nr:phloretin 4'-O-glucosyltransferase [Medicago truncatula]AET04103.1 flavonoid glucosyltransferase [Medicago truncatula]RHN42537.1 putative crocetin glucosyltransferase [Medicago truncatula]